MQKDTEERNYDTGAFTAAEKDSVQKALTSYLGEHDVPMKDLHYLLHPREALLKAANPYLRQEVLKKFPEKIAFAAGTLCEHEQPNSSYHAELARLGSESSTKLTIHQLQIRATTQH